MSCELSAHQMAKKIWFYFRIWSETSLWWSMFKYQVWLISNFLRSVFWYYKMSCFKWHTLVIITKWACHLHRNRFKSVIPSYNFYHHQCHLTCQQGTSSTTKLLPIYLFSWIHCILCNIVTRCCLSYIITI